MSEAVADWSGDRDYTGGDNNSGAQHVGDGDVNGPMIGAGGQFIGVNGDAPALEKFAENITIYAVPEPGKPEQPIDIKKLRKWPTPASTIGVVSGLITIAGVLPGFRAYQQIDALIQDPGTITLGPLDFPLVIWWTFTTIMVLAVAAWLWGRRKFLKRHVLWLPRQSWRRARAGIRAKNGKTYPCSLRLTADCRICGGKMRILSEMVNWKPQLGAFGRKIGTRWEPRAVCTRNPDDHWVRIDIARNDFNKPIH